MPGEHATKDCSFPMSVQCKKCKKVGHIVRCCIKSGPITLSEKARQVQEDDQADGKNCRAFSCQDFSPWTLSSKIFVVRSNSGVICGVSETWLFLVRLFCLVLGRYGYLYPFKDDTFFALPTFRTERVLKKSKILVTKTLIKFIIYRLVSYNLF